jgi:hypothetical protein
MTTLGYLIRSDPGKSFVETWSEWPLPFMNRTPAQSRYRDDLRNAITHLKAGSVLHATHTSRSSSRGPDLENLLFYNIGVSVFRGFAMDVLRFERKKALLPETPARLDFEAQHHVRYEVTGREGSPFHYTAADTLVASAGIVCSAPQQVRDLACLWRSFKTAMVIDARRTGLIGSSFAVQFTISAPPRHRFNLTGIVKPLTDAFVSALHWYRGVQLEEVVNRVSGCLACPPMTARELLLDTRSALLGPRAVPYLRSNGLQWSPADDGLIACQLIRKTSPGDSSIEIHGSLFAVPSQTGCRPSVKSSRSDLSSTDIMSSGDPTNSP